MFDLYFKIEMLITYHICASFWSDNSYL